MNPAYTQRKTHLHGTCIWCTSIHIVGQRRGKGVPFLFEDFPVDPRSYMRFGGSYSQRVRHGCRDLSFTNMTANSEIGDTVRGHLGNVTAVSGTQQTLLTCSLYDCLCRCYHPVPISRVQRRLTKWTSSTAPEKVSLRDTPVVPSGKPTGPESSATQTRENQRSHCSNSWV